ncbi:hypothetical protein IPM62_01495 [Candidatus Woesebacteria bacterium]|nr:MAG: hypothetical protein IPM62_01495 [Candidatus Woesebacteria bacterium]
MSLTKKDLDLIRQVIDDSMRDTNNPLKLELKADILDFKLEILKEIKALREEVAVTISYRDMIAKNEEDIKKLINIHPSFSHT